LKDEATAMSVFGAFADLFGIGSNTYSSMEADWGQDTGKEILQFQKKVGDTKFKEANDKFNKQFGDWMNNIKSNEKYKALTDEQKKTVITNKKAKIKEEILRSYGFKYKQQKSKPLPKL